MAEGEDPSYFFNQRSIVGDGYELSSNISEGGSQSSQKQRKRRVTNSPVVASSVPMNFGDGSAKNPAHFQGVQFSDNHAAIENMQYTDEHNNIAVYTDDYRRSLIPAENYNTMFSKDECNRNEQDPTILQDRILRLEQFLTDARSFCRELEASKNPAIQKKCQWIKTTMREAIEEMKKHKYVLRQLSLNPNNPYIQDLHRAKMYSSIDDSSTLQFENRTNTNWTRNQFHSSTHGSQSMKGESFSPLSWQDDIVNVEKVCLPSSSTCDNFFRFPRARHDVRTSLNYPSHIYDEGQLFENESISSSRKDVGNENTQLCSTAYWKDSPQNLKMFVGRKQYFQNPSGQNSTRNEKWTRNKSSIENDCSEALSSHGSTHWKEDDQPAKKVFGLEGAETLTVGQQVAAVEVECKHLNNKLIALQHEKINDDLCYQLSNLKNKTNAVSQMVACVSRRDVPNSMSPSSRNVFRKEERGCVSNSEPSQKMCEQNATYEKLCKLQLNIKTMEVMLKDIKSDHRTQESTIPQPCEANSSTPELRNQLPMGTAKRDNIRRDLEFAFPARRHYEAEGRANEEPDLPVILPLKPRAVRSASLDTHQCLPPRGSYDKSLNSKQILCEESNKVRSLTPMSAAEYVGSTSENERKTMDNYAEGYDSECESDTALNYSVYDFNESDIQKRSQMSWEELERRPQPVLSSIDVVGNSCNVACSQLEERFQKFVSQIPKELKCNDYIRSSGEGGYIQSSSQGAYRTEGVRQTDRKTIIDILKSDKKNQKIYDKNKALRICNNPPTDHDGNPYNSIQHHAEGMSSERHLKTKCAEYQNTQMDNGSIAEVFEDSEICTSPATNIPEYNDSVARTLSRRKFKNENTFNAKKHYIQRNSANDTDQQCALDDSVFRCSKSSKQGNITNGCEEISYSDPEFHNARRHSSGLHMGCSDTTNNRCKLERRLSNPQSSGLSNLHSLETQVHTNFHSGTFIDRLQNHIFQINQLCQEYQDHFRKQLQNSRCSVLNIRNSDWDVQDILACSQQLLSCLNICFSTMEMQQQLQQIQPQIRDNQTFEVFPNQTNPLQTQRNNLDETSVTSPSVSMAIPTTEVIQSPCPPNPVLSPSSSIPPFEAYMTNDTLMSGSQPYNLAQRVNDQTLNNQVPPRSRANNFLDNFRSCAHQNLLYTSSADINENSVESVDFQSRYVQPITSNVSHSLVHPYVVSTISPSNSRFLNMERYLNNSESLCRGPDLSNHPKKYNADILPNSAVKLRQTNAKFIRASAKSIQAGVRKDNMFEQKLQIPLVTPALDHSLFTFGKANMQDDVSNVPFSEVVISESEVAGNICEVQSDILHESNDGEHDQHFENFEEKNEEIKAVSAQDQNNDQSIYKIDGGSEHSLKQPEDLNGATESCLSASSQILSSSGTSPPCKQMSSNLIATGAIPKKARTQLFGSLGNYSSDSKFLVSTQKEIQEDNLEFQNLDNKIDSDPTDVVGYVTRHVRRIHFDNRQESTEIGQFPIINADILEIVQNYMDHQYQIQLSLEFLDKLRHTMALDIDKMFEKKYTISFTDYAAYISPILLGMLSTLASNGRFMQCAVTLDKKNHLFQNLDNKSDSDTTDVVGYVTRHVHGIYFDNRQESTDIGQFPIINADVLEILQNYMDHHYQIQLSSEFLDKLRHTIAFDIDKMVEKKYTISFTEYAAYISPVLFDMLSTLATNGRFTQCAVTLDKKNHLVNGISVKTLSQDTVPEDVKKESESTSANMNEPKILTIIIPNKDVTDALKLDATDVAETSYEESNTKVNGKLLNMEENKDIPEVPTPILNEQKIPKHNSKMSKKEMLSLGSVNFDLNHKGDELCNLPSVNSKNSKKDTPSKVSKKDIKASKKNSANNSRKEALKEPKKKNNHHDSKKEKAEVSKEEVILDDQLADIIAHVIYDVQCVIISPIDKNRPMAPSFLATVIAYIISNVRSRMHLPHKSLASLHQALDQNILQLHHKKFSECEEEFLACITYILSDKLSCFTRLKTLGCISSSDTQDMASDSNAGISLGLFATSGHGNKQVEYTLITEEASKRDNAEADPEQEIITEADQENEIEISTEADLAEADQSPGQQGNGTSLGLISENALPSESNTSTSNCNNDNQKPSLDEDKKID